MKQRMPGCAVDVGDGDDLDGVGAAGPGAAAGFAEGGGSGASIPITARPSWSRR